MSNVVVTNLIRFFIFVFIQVLLLIDINIGGDDFPFFQIIIYPVFLILLPIRTPHALLVLIGFLTGIFVDAFYDTYGVHASACVFISYIRPFVLKIFEPKGGYNLNYSPTKNRFGFTWFSYYAGTMMIAFLFFYFSVDAFTFFYLDQIFLKTFFSFLISTLIIYIYIYLLDPVE